MMNNILDLSDFPVQSTVDFTTQPFLTCTPYSKIKTQVRLHLQPKQPVQCIHFFEMDEVFADFYFKLLKYECGSPLLESLYEITPFVITPDISILMDGNVAYNTTALFATVAAASFMTELYPARTIPCVPLELLYFPDMGSDVLSALYPPAHNSTIAVRNPTAQEWGIAYDFLSQYQNVILFNYQKFRTAANFTFPNTQVFIIKREKFKFTPVLTLIYNKQIFLNLKATIDSIDGDWCVGRVMNFRGRSVTNFGFATDRIVGGGDVKLGDTAWLSLPTDTESVSQAVLIV